MATSLGFALLVFGLVGVLILLWLEFTNPKLLESSELRSETEVLTGSKSAMRRTRTSDVKAIWIGEHRFVAITGATPKDYLVARTNRLITDLSRFHQNGVHRLAGDFRCRTGDRVIWARV